MARSAAERAQLAADAQAAVAAAGSQKALANALGVSPRMVRHALAGNKGWSLQAGLRTVAQGGLTSAPTPLPPTAIAGPRTPRGRNVRQPVIRVGTTESLTSTARQTVDGVTLNTLQRRMVDNAPAGARAAIRVEWRDASGANRTASLYRKGGISAAALQALLAQGNTLADLLTQSGSSDAPAGGATVTGVTLTIF